MGNFPQGTLVMSGNDLRVVIREELNDGERGYVLEDAEPTDPGRRLHTSWVTADYVTLAIVGDNVCPRPRLTHHCNLYHVYRPDKLPPAPYCPAGHGQMRRRDLRTREADWCGTWFDCQHPAFRCHNSYLFQSEDLLRELDLQRNRKARRR